MLFLSLTVDNFGVCRGRYAFEDGAGFENYQRHHVTVFSGHNGAGKNTIFQGMMLALYGSMYLGDALRLKEYNNFILSRMHRLPEEMKYSGTGIGDSGIKLKLQYVQSGRPFDIEIERRWKKHGHTIEETLKVLKDGQPPDVDLTDYQAWIDDLISPGVGSLCFFDAEQLDALASQDQQSDVLRVTLTRLLGLDWVQYLEQDLDQLMMRQGSTKKIENLYVKVLELQTERDRLEEQLALLRRQLDEVNSDISSCESALAQQERILAAEGGAYAARRPVLQSRLHTIEKEVEVLSNQLHDLCADLLPFALAPELCLQLYKRLTAEVEIRKQHIINTMLQEKLPEIEEMLLADEVWQGLDISQQGRRYLTQRLTEKLKSFEQLQSPDKLSIIHQLSESEHQQLRKWISQTIRDIPQQVQLLGDRLRNLKKEKRRIETDLQRAPDDEVLAPIHAEISRLRGILAEKQKRQAPLNEHIGSLQFQRDEKRRLLQEAVDQYEKVRKFEKQLKYAEQSKNVLRTYKDALTRQKLRTLEDALTTCFNKLCRKEHLLSRVNVDPEDLSIHLEGVGGT